MKGKKIMAEIKHKTENTLSCITFTENNELTLVFSNMEVTLNPPEIDNINKAIKYWYARNHITNYLINNTNYNSLILDNTDLIREMANDLEYEMTNLTCDEEIQARRNECIEAIIRDYESPLEEYLS